MKRIVYCVLSFMLLTCVLSGCGKSTVDNGKTENSQLVADDGQKGGVSDATEALDSNVETSGQQVITEASESEKSSETSERPVEIPYAINSSEFTDYDCSGDGDPATLMERCYDQIVINSEDFPELKKAIEDSNKYVADSINENHDEYIKSMKEVRTDSPEALIFFEMKQRSGVYRADSSFFSFLSSCDSYLGGAHPYLSRGGHNFDSKTGEELNAPKLFSKNPEQFCQILTDKMFEAYPGDEKYDFWPLDSLYDNHDDAEANKLMREFLYEHYLGPNYDYTLQFVLDNENVYVIFPAYEMAYYAFGEVWVEIPFEELEGVVNENYILK